MNTHPAAINDSGENVSFARINPLFICGMPRSGTTLLMSLLDGHPEILAYAAESHFFLEFVAKSRAFSDVQKIALAEQKLLHPFQGPYHKKYLSHLSYHAIRASFLQYLDETDKHYRDYLAGAMFAYGTASEQLTPDVRYWLDKTPGNEHFASQIFSWWEHAKCIHMLRDPRDVYASWHQRAERHKRDLTLDGFAYSWLMSAYYARNNLGQYGPDRYLVIRYEDLVCNPEEQLQRVISFLEIQHNPVLNSPTKVGGTRNWRGNSALRQGYDGISKDTIGKWQRDESLRQEAIRVLELLLRRSMFEHRYIPEYLPSLRAFAGVIYCHALLLLRRIRDWWKQTVS